MTPVHTSIFNRLPIRGFVLQVRQPGKRPSSALSLSVAIGLGLLVSAMLLTPFGVSPGELGVEILRNVILDRENLLTIVNQAAPLVLVGLAAAISFRSGFWNLGIEGQMIWGGICATAVTYSHFGTDGSRIFLMAVAASAGGAVWLLLPAYLKMRRNVSEIISTLLLNYVAAFVLSHLLYGQWHDPADAYPHSVAFLPSERISGSALGITVAVPVVALLCVAMDRLLSSTRFGIYLDFVRTNLLAARANGLPATPVILGAMLISGAMSGWAGLLLVAGTEGRLTQSFFQGYGFAGILIAFIGLNSPRLVPVAALFVSAITVAGQDLQIAYQVPFAMTQVVQAVLVIFIAAAEFFTRFRLVAPPRSLH